MICHARILRERIRVWTRRIRLVRKSEFSDRMHEDRSAGFDQPPSTERANKPWIGFLPALHYPSIYWWHYVMVSIIQPWTWDRGLLWLTLSFFIYITAKPVGYIYPKEISINTVKFLYQTIAHLDSSMQSLDALRSDHALYACRTSGVPDHWSLHAYCCLLYTSPSPRD